MPVNVLAVGTYCYVAVCGLGGARRFGVHRGRKGAGAYRGGRPPTACSREISWRSVLVMHYLSAPLRPYFLVVTARINVGITVVVVIDLMFVCPVYIC